MKKQIIKFLKDNGFKLMEPNSYANDFCGVVFENGGITLAFNSGDTIYHKSHEFGSYLWLIGALYHFSLTECNPKLIQKLS